MSSKRKLASFLILCIMIHLSGCYTQRSLSIENFEPNEKRCKIITIYKRDGEEQRIDPARIKNQLLLNDTLIIELFHSKYYYVRDTTYKIPISEIKSVVVKDLHEKKTIGLTVALFGGAVILSAIVYAFYVFFSSLVPF